MGSLNVAEWSADQVADWISGLEPSVASYVPALRARGLDGAKLLTLRCDDLEYLGMHIIGHQELLLEAVEHLRNFQYEVSRECVQQLALRVSVVATTLARALRHHTDARLETQTLADVARTVHAVKPLVCWLDRWALWSRGAQLAERRAALLTRCLEAATCAQRERFADQPARAVAAAAASAAATADYIVQEVSDPMILQPASLESVTLRQNGKPLGFEVVPSFCGHHQIADIRFGSPAHASGAVHIGDEIVQVGSQCVVGWSGGAVRGACCAAPAPLLQLRLRRRAAILPTAFRVPRPCELTPPPLPVPAEAREAREAGEAREAAEARSSSDESEPLSPPASPSHLHLHLDHTRMYPPKPRSMVQRRHTISGGTPFYKRPSHAIEQLWQELKQQRGTEGGSECATPASSDIALYARDKAVSCSTGLELSPRPRTCLGMVREERRARLDKSHSTPAYEERDARDAREAPPDTIPESPTTPTTELPKCEKPVESRKASPQISADERAEAKERVLETINIAMMEHRRRSGVSLQQVSGGSTPEHCEVPPRRAPSPRGVLRAVPPAPPAPPAPLKPLRHGEHPHISLPLRQLSPPPPPPPLNSRVPPPPAPIVLGPDVRTPAPRGLFVSSKTRSLKKKSSILAKRRLVPWRCVSARGASGAVWQRVRARDSDARWAHRHLLLAHNLLYAYKDQESTKADCMIYLEGFTVCAAGEVKSRAHAFKVYHTGKVFYFACESRDNMLAWIQLIHRATLLPSLVAQQMDISKQYSETEYSDSESETEGSAKWSGDKEKEKSKFGSLKKLRTRMQRSESHEHVAHSSTSLDRKYLRFFSRNKTKDDNKTPKNKTVGVPIPTEHYRSYRRPTAARPPSPPPRRPPAPHNYIHASNPNLLDFDKSDFVTKPALHVPNKPKPKTEKLVGLVTLEQFMLKKQAEERRQVYTNRVLMGVERHLRNRLDDIVPDVIYGEVGTNEDEATKSPKPVSVTGKDGYEKLVWGEERQSRRDERWRDSLRRNDRVHAGSRPAAPSTAPVSWNSSSTASESRGSTAQYPHLQCPPTFQPETYSLARLPPRHNNHT